MKVYVNDMIVKSTEEDRYIIDLKEAFRELKKYQMKLNPNKCAFGVGSDKFLGFFINQKEIEANPQKIGLLKIKCPTSIKEIQQLTGRIVALNQFIFESAERCLSFFKVLKNIKNFSWIEECQTASEDLKKYLGSLSLLSKSIEGEELYMYIFVSPFAVSSILI